MASKLRIAVLECDTPIDTVRNQYGTYGDIFEAFFQRGVGALKDSGHAVDLEVSKWDVVEAQQYPDMDTVHGILITGSKHCSFDDQPWIAKLVAYVQKAYQLGQPRVLGVCFGHQIIARALGASVGRNDAGWEISTCQVQLTTEGSALMGGRESLTLHQMHRDIVLDIPKGITGLGFSDRCLVQGLYLPRRLLSFQAHPEFNEKIMSEILAVRRNQAIFTQEMFEDGQARAPLAHDGNLVARVSCKFLLDP
ncbi:hypothetical protein A1O3_03914 [Capronia epimyces CBS 606.96]|uniref:Glutamine amidotransferase domain-containing protein n=1 Tax=Capronia epimyces CBS 606.96 TaxID=1182542 RepID=W9YBE5_9EURO|nr:uncharacterized protein A1O3_03914 [Capronia epimyces CBS 606.96]EXJ86960.1 hypothetical protein A1O3_03914 [Capronia epimyces CBS 606.96]